MDAIRQFNDQQYSTAEWDAIVLKLNETLVHNVEEYDSISKLGTILKDHIENHPAGGGGGSYISYSLIQWRLASVTNVNKYSYSNYPTGGTYVHTYYHNNLNNALTDPDIVPVAIVPFDAKVKRIILSDAIGTAGNLKLGVIANERLAGGTPTNGVILLDKDLGMVSINSIRNFDIDANDISQTTLNAGAFVSVLFSRDTASSNYEGAVVYIEFEKV